MSETTHATPLPHPEQITVRTLAAVIATITVAALLLGVALIAVLSPTADATEPPQPTATTSASPVPLGHPVAAPANGGTHGYVATQADGQTPVAFDPCHPIHYVLRPDHAPAGGEALVHAAIAHLSEITGLRFVYDGTTTETLAPRRAAFQPDTYGDRWAPVLIQWSSDTENPGFADPGQIVLAETGSAPVHTAGEATVYVTGQMDLSATWFTWLLTDPTVPDGPARARAIALHELGHLVGLDHVADPGQLMYSFSTQRDYQPGDLAGLAAIGGGACIPSP